MEGLREPPDGWDPPCPICGADEFDTPEEYARHRQ